MHGRPDDLAFDATIRTAAPFQRHRREERAHRKVAFVVKREDLQKKVRVRRAANLVLFVVDASWSMAAAERIEATKGAVLSLLHDAYQRRDQVGLIVFQREEARIVLPPTSSVELAQQALRNVPVGGKTPLSAGLLAAFRVCTARSPAQSRDQAADHHPDGRRGQRVGHRDAATGRGAADGDDDPRRALPHGDHQHGASGVRPRAGPGPGDNFVGGPCYTLPELKAEALLKTVRQELSLKPGERATGGRRSDPTAVKLPEMPGSMAAGNRP